MGLLLLNVLFWSEQREFPHSTDKQQVTQVTLESTPLFLINDLVILNFKKNALLLRALREATYYNFLL